MDLLVSMAAWWLPVVILLFSLRLGGKGDVDWSWIGGAIIAFTIYSLVVFNAPKIPGFPQIDGAQYNWTGKIAAIGTTLVMIAAAVKANSWITLERLGLTFTQNAGSIKPALIATACMVAFVVLLQMIGGEGPNHDVETLAYQATLPGIDEELIFRGLLLTLVAGALRNWESGWKWAGIAVTVIFAFGHSFFYSTEGIQFDPIALVVVAILGGLMMFIRLRTGSILLPLIAHNLTNVANQLV